jgi:aryl-alcohol dehydrogenase-like predicted oxidoreductase
MTNHPYYTLGRSGLRVSRLALGTMTFGTECGWGCDRETARALFARYLEVGGNFIDTADVYGGGASEAMLGEFIAERGGRDRLVVSTKYTLNYTNRDADPNAAGNGRKNMLRALEDSLRRLKTDYVDLYFVHAWDGVTPVEEVMRGLDDLVRAGKVRYVGLSDVPAWYASRAQTLADWRGFAPLCALQMEYSLVQRGVEYEFVQMGQALGMSLVAWSPLGSGFLSGKYRPGVDIAAQSDGRLKATAAVAMPTNKKMTARNWAIAAELERVAAGLGRSMAQVAINWVANRPTVGAVLLGASRLGQLEETLGALDFELPPELAVRLDEASALVPHFPYAFIDGNLPQMHGGARVEDKPPQHDRRLERNYLIPE